MKLQLCTLFIILSLLILEATSEKVKKHKKFRRHRKVTTTSTEVVPDADESRNIQSDGEFKVMEDDSAEETSVEADTKSSNEQNRIETPEEPNLEITDNRIPIHDPCSSVHCGAGRICDSGENGEPQCVCIPNCPVETEPRRKVCSNHNETWSSDCAVYQQRCWCDTKDDRCKGEEYRHVHIEYYGECREMPKCAEEEISDFPRRMRDWLFNIMRDLADRQELAPHYLKMEREAESNLTRRWSNAAVWKWCDLDGHPHDRFVSRHELFPIRAPLMSLEHCIAPFLNSCDKDDDHRITLQEWGKCLEIDAEELEDKCDEIAGIDE